MRPLDFLSEIMGRLCSGRTGSPWCHQTVPTSDFGNLQGKKGRYMKLAVFHDLTSRLRQCGEKMASCQSRYCMMIHVCNKSTYKYTLLLMLLDAFVFLFVSRHLCILLASLGHELREVLLFRLGHCFGLQIYLGLKQPRNWRVRCTFILTTSAPP